MGTPIRTLNEHGYDPSFDGGGQAFPDVLGDWSAAED